MLKVRLMGTTNDIKWFLKILGREKKLHVISHSDLLTNVGTKKYFRCYVEVDRKENASSGDSSMNKPHVKTPYGVNGKRHRNIVY